MGGLFAVIVAAGVLAGGWLAAANARRKRMETWTDAARSAGLTDIVADSSFWAEDVLRGRCGSIRVRFETYRRGKYESGTRITMEGNSGLTLRAETFGTAIGKAFGDREITIGDKAFDDDVCIHGRPDVALAVFDAESRPVISALLHRRIRVGGYSTIEPNDVAVRDGDLHADFQEKWGRELTEIPAAVKALLDAARRLEAPPDIPGRIAKNTLNEPEWQVRLENVAFLAANHPRHPATRETLVRACQDERQEIQLRAALALGGDEGRAVLLDIASQEWAQDDCAACAIAELGEHLPRDRALSILGHALKTRRVETAKASIAALGRSGGPDVVPQLAKVLAVESGELAVASANALGACREPAAEEPLLAALRSRSAEVRVAVVQALEGSAPSMPCCCSRRLRTEALCSGTSAARRGKRSPRSSPVSAARHPASFLWLSATRAGSAWPSRTRKASSP